MSSAFAMLGLDQRATVYGRGADGAHSAVLAQDLPVRLASPASEGSATERAELAATRRLLYGPEPALPEGCEVEVDGERWTAVRGTQARWRGPTGDVVYQTCELVRASGGGA